MGQMIAPYTAIFAVIFSLWTLRQQYSQFVASQIEQRDAASQTQWREALKNLSIKDDSSVLSSALQMETFFRVHEYASLSRSSAATLLPLLGDGNHFDIVWKGIVTYTDESNQDDLISVAQNIGSEELALFHEVAGRRFSSTDVADQQLIDFLVDPDRPERKWTNEGNASAGTNTSAVAPTDNEYERDEALKPIKRATACTWKLRSITQSLQDLWAKKTLALDGKDLTGVMLVDGDLSGVDFSKAKLPPTLIHHCNLTGADFAGTQLDQVIITQPTGFKDSKWAGANWWEAEMLPCDLAQYLMKEYAPPDPAKGQSRVAQSCGK